MGSSFFTRKTFKSKKTPREFWLNAKNGFIFESKRLRKQRCEVERITQTFFLLHAKGGFEHIMPATLKTMTAFSRLDRSVHKCKSRTDVGKFGNDNVQIRKHERSGRSWVVHGEMFCTICHVFIKGSFVEKLPSSRNLKMHFFF